MKVAQNILDDRDGRDSEGYNRLSSVGLGGPHMKYKVALIESEEAYAVSVPGLPGCWSQGATEEEALANIRDAIREYLSVVDDELRSAEVREIDVAV